MVEYVSEVALVASKYHDSKCTWRLGTIEGNHAATPISGALPFIVHLLFRCFPTCGSGGTTGTTEAVCGGEELAGASPNFRVGPVCNDSKISF